MTNLLDNLKLNIESIPDDYKEINNKKFLWLTNEYFKLTEVWLKANKRYAPIIHLRFDDAVIGKFKKQHKIRDIINKKIDNLKNETKRDLERKELEEIKKNQGVDNDLSRTNSKEIEKLWEQINSMNKNATTQCDEFDIDLKDVEKKREDIVHEINTLKMSMGPIIEVVELQEINNKLKANNTQLITEIGDFKNKIDRMNLEINELSVSSEKYKLYEKELNELKSGMQKGEGQVILRSIRKDDEREFVKIIKEIDKGCKEINEDNFQLVMPIIRVGFVKMRDLSDSGSVKLILSRTENVINHLMGITISLLGKLQKLESIKK
jgi:hypothetical protein